MANITKQPITWNVRKGPSKEKRNEDCLTCSRIYGVRDAISAKSFNIFLRAQCEWARKYQIPENYRLKGSPSAGSFPLTSTGHRTERVQAEHDTREILSRGHGPGEGSNHCYGAIPKSQQLLLPYGIKLLTGGQRAADLLHPGHRWRSPESVEKVKKKKKFWNSYWRNRKDPGPDH